jgi:hypothetical protein
MGAMRLLKSSKLRRVAVGAVALWLTLPSAVLACPLCKDAIANDPVAAAFNWTTLLMIGMPSLLVASIGGWVFYVYRRAARRETAETMAWYAAWPEKENET